MTVVDADGHVYEPEDLWTQRMDAARWGDWIPKRVVEDGCYDIVYTGGVVRGGGRELQDAMAAAVGMTAQQFHDLTNSLKRAGGHDPNARLADMDADGIDVSVLYPSQAMFFGPCDPIDALHDVGFVAACQRAYNEWLSDFCRADPRRLFGIAAVPLQEPALAVRELEYAVGTLGLRGAFIRPSAYVDELPLNHSVYDPFWRACAELDVPVALHPGVHIDTPGACRKFELVALTENILVSNMAMDELHGGSALGQAIGNTVDMVVSLGRLLMGGVCERFPDLRIVFLESGGGWVPTQLERMDEQVKAFPLEKRWLSLLPSEYFKRQCWVSFEPEEWNLAACAEFLGVERVVWASDYPHPEYHEGVVEEVRESIAPLDLKAQARVLGANAIELYGLPMQEEAVGKYMFIASYNAEGISGVLETGGTARVDAISEAAKSLGGKLESFYFGFGGEDAYVTVDLPDNAAAAALAMTASASGVVGVRTVVLVTPGEIDDAAKRQVTYRAADS